MSLRERYLSNRTHDQRSNAPLIERLPIIPGTNFLQVWDAVVTHVFTPEPWDVFIIAGKNTIFIPASSIIEVDSLEHVDRRRAMAVVAYACWRAETVILSEPSEKTSRKMPATNTPLQKFIHEKRPELSYLDTISGK